MINTVEDRTLTLNDRCDACNAAAMVIATFLNGELMFCGHHAKNKKVNLIEKAISVFDPQGILNTID
jgi:hypothetical protein